LFSHPPWLPSLRATYRCRASCLVCRLGRPPNSAPLIGEFLLPVHERSSLSSAPLADLASHPQARWCEDTFSPTLLWLGTRFEESSVVAPSSFFSSPLLLSCYFFRCCQSFSPPVPVSCLRDRFNTSLERILQNSPGRFVQDFLCQHLSYMRGCV